MSINILMPALSPTMTEGKLSKWLVNVGDQVQSGDIIAEIETDKATMEVEAADDGVLLKILVEAGNNNVAVNAPIAVLGEEGEVVGGIVQTVSKDKQPDDNHQITNDKQMAQGSTQETAAIVSELLTQAQPMQKSVSRQLEENKDQRIFITPLARRIAIQNDIDLYQIKGSGPHGRIIKVDVENANTSNKKPNTLENTVIQNSKLDEARQVDETVNEVNANPYEPEFELIALNPMRKTIASRLSQSKREAPHFYLEVECKLDGLLSLRQQLNERAKDGVKISVNDMLIKASAIALKRVPEVNASWSDEGIKLYKDIDISIAVAIDGGLITPIVKGADKLGLESISQQMKDLASKAKTGKLMPEEYMGGGFSISNLGMYGIDRFYAVINPPQACILALGAGMQKVCVANGTMQIATIMCANLSVDHRAVDGATAARWMSEFRLLVEDPISLML